VLKLLILLIKTLRSGIMAQPFPHQEYPESLERANP
jgi:hypothetical protein